MSRGGHVSPEFDHRGSSFALIVVLFILLIIVGCAFIC
ncbi:YjcZ family sporulation protein [Bacillus sp. EAC]|nr:YjcZ family sporulation protein [Bacillus sp. EAC]